jgi:hypothetical protein
MRHSYGYHPSVAKKAAMYAFIGATPVRGIDEPSGQTIEYPLLSSSGSTRAPKHVCSGPARNNDSPSRFTTASNSS